MTPLIDLQHISRHYQSGESVIRALDDVSLTIYPGEFVAIMGQSGSGKSTLMNILGCLDRPTDGSYRVQGHETSMLESDSLAMLRSRMFGFIFQRYNLLANTSALENVEIPALYSGLPRADRLGRAQHLLQDLGLGNRGGHRPTQLSGGQQQRVAIARALMNDPHVILADEPTGALDSASGRDVMALLADLHAQGRSIILITHDEKVAAHAPRIIRLQDGRIISDPGPQGPVQDVGLKASEASIELAPPRLHVDVPEAVRIASRSLQTNFFRTALTLLGIVIGVAAVITMLAVGNGSKQNVIDQISAMGTNLLNIRPGMPGMRPTGDIATLVPDDATAIAALPNIVAVVPERSSSQTIRYGNIDDRSSVQGVGEGFPLARDWTVERGTFFTKQDVQTYAPVAVLGISVASALFPDGEDPIGKFILVKNIPFEVIGVMASKGAAPWGGDQDDTVYVPYTTGMIRLFGGTYLNSIVIKVDDSALIDETQQEITDLLTARHRTEDFSVRSTSSFLSMASETQNTLTILLGAVAAISLLVGGIGVMNIMLVNVIERTREIGIRMATGARRQDIMFQFSIEAAVVCTIGGLLGVALGFAAGGILSLFNVHILFSWGPVLLAFGCAVATGLVFGYLPARDAAKMDPVVALSSE